MKKLEAAVPQIAISCPQTNPKSIHHARASQQKNPAAGAWPETTPDAYVQLARAAVGNVLPFAELKIAASCGAGASRLRLARLEAFLVFPPGHDVPARVLTRARFGLASRAANVYSLSPSEELSE